MAPDNPKRPKVPTSGYTKEGRFDRVFVFGDLFNVLLKVEVYMHALKSRSSAYVAFLLFVCMGCMSMFNPMLHAQTPTAPAYPKELTSYRDVVKQVLPAVVSIEHQSKAVATTKSSTQRRQPGLDNSQVPEEFRRFFEDFMPFNVPNMPNAPRHGMGSGFLADPSGVILTNYHVVKGAEQVTVRLQDGRTFVSKDIKSDPKTDLAVVRIETKGSLPYLQFGDSAAMEIGDRVLSVGAPFGLTGSVTAGIISGKGRSPSFSIYEDYLQTDAAINPGNSGGPLVTLEGKVIGVNTAIKSSSGGSQGVGLAIPSNAAQNIMVRLLKDGSVHRGYLGVQVRKLDPDVGARLGAENKTGVVVAKVLEGSPAAKAGVQAGDIITSVNGTSIQSPTDLQRRVVDLPLKKPATLAIIRDGKARDLQATLEEPPTDLGQARNSSTQAPDTQNGMRLEKIGIEIADMSANLGQRFGHSEQTAGAVITRVEPGSLAETANLEPGTLITKVDTTRVQSAAAAKTALEKASLERGILLQVQFAQNGGTGYVMIKAATDK